MKRDIFRTFIIIAMMMISLVLFVCSLLLVENKHQDLGLMSLIFGFIYMLIALILCKKDKNNNGAIEI